ncbi:MAG: DUF1592 domain-containing protein [Opitutaceae bacterium]
MQKRRAKKIRRFAKLRRSIGWWGGSIAALAGGGAAEAPRPAAFPSAASPVAMIEQNCVDCHDSGNKKGGLELVPADALRPGSDPQTWEQVVRKLRHRQMPPIGEPRPDEATYDRIVAYLQSALDREADEHPNPGRTATFRRLTRTEYHNAIRDLLALEIDAAALLPKDEVSRGFDNVTVGELSPTLLERYLGAARKIAAQALGRPSGAPQTQIFQVPLDLTQEGHIAGLPFGTRGGAAVKIYFPADADYELQLRLTRDRNEKVEGLRRAHEMDLLVDGTLVKRFEVASPPRGEKHDHVDRHLNFRLRLPAGEHEVAGTFVPTSSALLESERAPNLAHFNADRHPRTQPALYTISVVGPHAATGPGETPSRRRIFTRQPTTAADEDQCANEIIATVMRRAFRRPVTAEDLRGPLRFYAETKATQGFEAGIEMALRAVLVSPHFLFRIESIPQGIAPGEVYRIPDVEFASRLSFFLWNSIPDDELLEKATRGELQNGPVLRQQTERMLRDARSEALVTSFAAQWLYLRNLEWVSPDARLFMDFDDNLRQAMRRETEMFFASILRENRSALDLLRADYTFLNERLARHYGIPHVYGSEFRRVTLPEKSGRRGLLSQASILTVTSHPNRTSPVLRGNWILGNILGMPPKPPPPDVPQLKEQTAEGKFLSVREQIAHHREKPTCATCHNLMDPVGFALDHFDAVGRWRTTEGGEAIDASGRFPDGTEFRGAGELQDAILKRPDLFMNTVAEKLLTYALGRGVEYFDAPSVRKMVNEAGHDDYRLSALIVALVNSTPFQMRKSP